MIKVLISLLLCITGLATRAQTSDEHSLLWRISGNGLAKPSYLFGTIHLICPADYVWTNKMMESLAASDKVCFEMDLDDPAVMMAASEGFMDSTGKKLKDYYTAAEYQQLRKFVKDSLGMDVVMFQQMKPVALQSVIGMKASRCNDAVSYEERIMKTAIADHKEILGLEAASEQIDVLESQPDDTVAKSILDDIKNFAESRVEYDKLVAAYKQQDLAALYKMIVASKDMEQSMAIYLDDRNKKWIPNMSGKMKVSSVFFAVGAGHLAGQKGVINLLRKAGYTLDAVK